MPSGFDFCPVCGQDQRARLRRPATQQLRIHPAPRSQDVPPYAGHPGANAPPGTPGFGAPPAAPAPPSFAVPGAPPGSALTPGPMVHGSPGYAPPGQGAQHTVPNPVLPPDVAGFTVPAPGGGRPADPHAIPGMAPAAAAVPPVVADVQEDDATRPEVLGQPSIEEAAFGPASSPSQPGTAATPGDDDKTIPHVKLRQGGLASDAPDGPRLTMPTSIPPRPASLDAVSTQPDRPGGFSGGPTGEAPPEGVNVPQRGTGAPVLAAPAQAPQSRFPTHPGVNAVRIVLVSRDGTEGESFPFSGESMTVGRTHGDVLFPEDPFLSPVHVRLTRTGNGVVIADTGSTNGVYLRIRGMAPVYPGDQFMIGHQLLRLDQLDSQAQEHSPGLDGTRLFGTPLQPAWGRVTQVGRGGVAGDQFYLRGSRVTFGREGGDLVFPNDPFVSREHARLRLEITGQAMAVFLEDLGSANGTFVRIRGATEIAGGDTFRVGDQILKLRLD